MQTRCFYLLMAAMAVMPCSFGCSLFPAASQQPASRSIQPRMTHSAEMVRSAPETASSPSPPHVVRLQSGEPDQAGYGGRAVGSLSPQDNRATRRGTPAAPSSVTLAGYNDSWGTPSTSTGYPPVDSFRVGAGVPRPKAAPAAGRLPNRNAPRRSTVAPPVGGPRAAPLGVGPPPVGARPYSTQQPPVNVPPIFGLQPDAGPNTLLPSVTSGRIAPVDSLPPVPPVEPYEFIDINAIVREARTGRLMVGAGVNSSAGLVGSVVIDEQNFDWRRLPTSFRDVWDGKAWRGGGQRLRVEAQPGTFVQRYLVSFTEPYFLDTNVSLGLSAFFFDRRYFDWTERRMGGRVSLGYQFPDDWSISTSLRAEQIELRDPRVFPAVPEVAAALGGNDEFGVKAILSHDTRDSAFLPTQGHTIQLGYEQVFGTYQYPIATVDARQFFTLRERIDGSGRHVLSVGGKLGVSGDDTPVYANFYAGGFSTMRGFAFRGASPKNGDVIVGGEFQLLGSIEYMFPLTADDMLRGVVFVDAGTVEEDVEIDFNDFRVAPGVGLRISHPGLGPAPIALDLAFPVMREDGDSIRNFTFFIGFRR